MGFRKMAALSTMLAVIFSAPGCAAETEEYHFQDVVNEVVTSYGLDPVEIQFADLDGHRLGMVECTVNSNQCTVSFDYCVLDLDEYMQNNIAVHEAAHYVNAKINRLYDHGRQWERLVRENGYRPIEIYEHWGTEECD